MSTESEQQEFVTEDLTFVTVLLIEGIHHKRMENRDGGCRWIYVGNSIVAQIMDHLSEYNDDACYVEPRQFVRKLGMMRQQMYGFLGHRPPPVRSSQRQPSRQAQTG